MTVKTMMTASSSSEVSDAKREKLMALQARYRSLLAQLPGHPSEFAGLDAAGIDAKLLDIELIANEMTTINQMQLAILNESGGSDDDDDARESDYQSRRRQ